MSAPSHSARVNFGGNQRWQSRVHQPSSKAEILDILARHSGQRVRALGSLHSWSGIAADADVSLDMSRFDSVELVARDGETLARVGAGCRLQDLLDRLHRISDRTLPSLGAILKQTVSGAISTGTHGSGRPGLSHHVARIRAAVFDAASGQPVIREFTEGPELRAARCGLGCMGVILAVELQTVPKFMIAETLRIHAALDDILRRCSEHPLTQFLWMPYSWIWVAYERRPLEHAPQSWLARAKARFFRASNFTVVDVGFHLGVKACRRLGLGALRALFTVVPRAMLKNIERVDDSEHVLTLAHDLFRHEEMELFVRERDLPRAMEIIRAAIETCAGGAAMPSDIEKQLRDADAYDALVALRGRYLHHYPVFCRRVMPEDTLVSMAASVDVPLVSISLFTYDRPERRESYYAFCAWLARTLLRLCDARPHWGKHFPLDHAEIARLYPRMDEFRRLCATVDPGGVFRNTYTARVLNLQPGRADRPSSQGGPS